MATQAQIYKDAQDTGVLVAQDLAILAKPWVKGVTCPDPLFDANGIVTGALADFLTVGEIAKKDGAKFSSDTKLTPIEGYGARAPRRRLIDTDEGTLNFHPQEARQIAYMIQQNWDAGAFQTTATGGWRATKKAGTRPKYWTIFMLGEDSNDETGEPIWQWWHVGKTGTDKGSEVNLAMDAESMGDISLAMLEDGDYMYDMGIDGPGWASMAADLGYAGTQSKWTVTIGGTPSGGTFTLTVGGQTTSGIAYNATNSAVKTALEALSSVGAGNVTVTGSAGGPFTVTLPNGGTLTASGSGLTGGTSPSVTVAAA
ncbi:hypothetical protein [Gordonia sp. (in: high G+C Gram-positive bacteria)]|uniref:hypothetical protein n=1 Tax=Gordonia sp. (in: high G+C Gram-positive bacteria) TaxID=84139 RepID=UPI0039E52DF6